MAILAAILILGASGSAERSMETDASIGRIVASVAWGAVSDGVHGIRPGKISDIVGRLQAPFLTIDGKPRTGLRAWGEAAIRVGAYASDARRDGSVGLAYRLRVRRFDIATTTSVSDGRIVKTVDAWWTEVVPVGRQTKRIPIHVSIVIRATERGTQTYLLGTAAGHADTREFRCGFIRRIAERQAERSLTTGLAACLWDIERGGRVYYAGGDDLARVLDGIKLGIEIGGRLRR